MLGLARFVWQHPLARRNRPGAMLRVLRWQLASRLLDGPIAVPFVEDTILLMRRSMHGATGNWYCGLHEPGEMAFVLHVLRPGDLFVDVGANVGSYTVLAAGGTGADVVAFEPVPSTFASLQRNVVINGLGDRVALANIGLGSEAAVLRFTSGSDTTNHVLADGEPGAFLEVEVKPLDDALAGQVPRLVKIDVEGWEPQVLAGMSATLADHRLAAIIMETNDCGQRYGSASGGNMLRELGFREYMYDAQARTLSPGGANSNTIFIRDRDFVEQRIRGARRFRLCDGSI